MHSLVRSLALLTLLLAATLDWHWRRLFEGATPGPAGAAWISGWSRRILRVLGIDASFEGTLPDAGACGAAVVANHLSYLDILVLSAARPFIMVSKTEVRGWPLLGWITAQAGTIYVERADVQGGQKQTREDVDRMMAEAFRSGMPVVFFPEGTTTEGDTVLPFRRGLYHSVLANAIPIRAAALTYTAADENGEQHFERKICFVGDDAFGPHLFRVLGLRELKARVRFGANEITGEDRFALAQNSRDAVVDLYEEIAGISGIERGLSLPPSFLPASAPKPPQHLFDRPVETLGSVYAQVGASR